MADVAFLKGLKSDFDGLSKNSDTFYFITDTKEFYLGNNPITSKSELEKIQNSIGTLSGLSTSVQTDLVSAINEVISKITTATNDSKITIEKDPDGFVYKIRQGTATAEDADSNIIGVINIPKDMVVSAGAIVVDPVGEDPGKYIELTIANAPTGKDKLYINVADLVDAYTPKSDAKQVQIAISEANEISATIVAGSITVTELANDAVETTKIKDASVTVAKLANDAVETDKVKNGAITLDKLGEDVTSKLGALEWGTF